MQTSDYLKTLKTFNRLRKGDDNVDIKTHIVATIQYAIPEVRRKVLVKTVNSIPLCRQLDSCL